MKKVKIKDLIEVLKTYNENTVISVNGYEGGIHDISADDISLTKIKSNVNDEWYYGEHEEDEKGKTKRLVIG